MACHTCASCHVCHMSVTCVTCHRLLGLLRGVHHRNCHHQYFLSPGAVTPQTSAGTVPKGSALSKWALSVTAPAVKPWQWTNHSSEQTTASLSPLLHQHHGLMAQTWRLLKSNTLKTERWWGQKAGSSAALQMTLPSSGQFLLKQWLRNSNDQAAALLTLLHGGQSLAEDTTTPLILEVKRWDYIKSPLRPSLPQKEQSFILP